MSEFPPPPAPPGATESGPQAPAAPALPWQVSELLASLHQRIDAHYGPLRVEGEVFGLSTPRSGHRYFSLKDGDGQLRCAWFRHAIRGQPLREGQKVLAHGRLAIYAPRGDLQMIVSAVEDAGEGALARAFQELKRRLEAEGLFAAERKPALPPRVRALLLITSPQAAALQDILVTLRRRDPFMRVELSPVSVQGPQAPAQIAAALAAVGADSPYDAVLLARGGGSLEDLQAFNDEGVARALAACPLPVVSAVGHETDFSISDFVASLRAATPTAAAELLSGDRSEQLARARQLRQRLQAQLQRRLSQARQRSQAAQVRLQRQSPQRQLALNYQRLDLAQRRLEQQAMRQLALHRAAWQSLCKRLALCSPQRARHNQALQLEALQARMRRAAQAALTQRQLRLRAALQRLQALSPRGVLDRGYALVHVADGLATRAAKLPAGQRIELEWTDGRRSATIEGSGPGS